VNAALRCPFDCIARAVAADVSAAPRPVSGEAETSLATAIRQATLGAAAAVLLFDFRSRAPSPNSAHALELAKVVPLSGGCGRSLGEIWIKEGIG